MTPLIFPEELILLLAVESLRLSHPGRHPGQQDLGSFEISLLRFLPFIIKKSSLLLMFSLPSNIEYPP